MPIEINAYGNCESDLIGSATRSCDITSFGDPIGIELFQKGFRVAVDVADFTTAWTDGVKAMQVLPYIGIYDFTQDTPDNEVATSSTGVMSTVRAGKPQYTFSYDRGGCFHKSLYNKRGNRRWDVGIVFENGILMAVSVDGTYVEGFNGGMLDVQTLKFQQGTDPQMSTAMLQLLNASQFNERFVFLTWESLGVDLSTIQGVIETDVEFAVAPTTSATLVVTVTSACNSDDDIPGLDEIASWRVLGVQTTPKTITAVAYNNATNRYTFTLSSALIATDTIGVALTGTGGVDVATDDDGVLFKGRTPIVTI